MNEETRPLLIVISAPSGTGKTTLCDRLLAAYGSMVYSVSCTTRGARGNEVDGKDYHFLSTPDFERYVDEDRFLEYAVVHGNYYGTLKETVREAMAGGHHVLLDIDVQGAAKIRNRLKDLPADNLLKKGFADVFIAPPSLDALRKRLDGRGTDSRNVIEHRLANAKEEMDRGGEYKYRVVNDDVDEAFQHLVEIVDKESRQNA